MDPTSINANPGHWQPLQKSGDVVVGGEPVIEGLPICRPVFSAVGNLALVIGWRAADVGSLLAAQLLAGPAGLGHAGPMLTITSSLDAVLAAIPARDRHRRQAVIVLGGIADGRRLPTGIELAALDLMQALPTERSVDATSTIWAMAEALAPRSLTAKHAAIRRDVAALIAAAITMIGYCSLPLSCVRRLSEAADLLRQLGDFLGAMRLTEPRSPRWAAPIFQAASRALEGDPGVVDYIRREAWVAASSWTALFEPVEPGFGRPKPVRITDVLAGRSDLHLICPGHAMPQAAPALRLIAALPEIELANRAGSPSEPLFVAIEQAQIIGPLACLVAASRAEQASPVRYLSHFVSRRHVHDVYGAAGARSLFEGADVLVDYNGDSETGHVRIEIPRDARYPGVAIYPAPGPVMMPLEKEAWPVPPAPLIAAAG